MTQTDTRTERKDQILEAAMTVFARSGFYQTRIDDIVREVGLSKGTIYWYFKSKDEIIVAIMERIFHRELDSIYAILEGEGSARERLLMLTRYAVDDLYKFKATGLLPLFQEFYALAIRDSTIQEHIQEYMHISFTFLVPLIEQGIARGEFRPVDPEAASFTFACIFDGMMTDWTITPDLIDLETRLPAAVELLLDGLAAH